MRESESQLAIYLLLLNDASSTGTGLHLIELLAKGVPWETPTNPGCCQDYKLLSTNRKQDPLLETRSTQGTEHEEVTLVPTWGLQAYVLVSPAQEGTLYATKRETLN